MKKILMLCMLVNAIYAMEETITPLPTTEDFEIAAELYDQHLRNVSSWTSYDQICLAHDKTSHIDFTGLQHWIDQEIVKRFEGNSAKQIAVARAYFLSPFGQQILPGESEVRLIEIGSDYTFALQELIDFGKIKIIADRYGRDLQMSDLQITSLADLDKVIPGLNKKSASHYTRRSITRIALNNNKITSLDFYIFKRFENIEDLNFSNNLLTSLDFSIEASFKKLRLINLNDNHLTYIDPNLFDGFEALEFVSLKNNPLTEENKVELKAKFRKRNIGSDIFIE